MPNYAPRVSLPYHDMSGVVELWSQSCDKMVVYEHTADEKVKTTHVHMIMINCKYKSQDTLCNQFRKLIHTERKGNGLWSWEHKDYPNPDENVITYMSKGKLEPVFVKNMTVNEIEVYKSRWTNYHEKKHKIIEETPIEGEVVQARVKQLTKWEILCLIDDEVSFYKKKYPNRIITKEIRNRIIVDLCKEQKLVKGIYQVQELSYAYCLHFDTETFLDTLNSNMKC